jgi:hypothetical protein
VKGNPGVSLRPAPRLVVSEVLFLFKVRWAPAAARNGANRVLLGSRAQRSTQTAV